MHRDILYIVFLIACQFLSGWLIFGQHQNKGVPLLHVVIVLSGGFVSTSYNIF
jgi:hypothetical protein